MWGSNAFHPKYFGENVFRMEGIFRAGQTAPAHFHNHFVEHWTVLKGTPAFVLSKEMFNRNPGKTCSAGEKYF